MGSASSIGVQADGTTLEKNGNVIKIKDSGVTSDKTDIVGIDNATGKINPINSTNFENLSGANLTGVGNALAGIVPTIYDNGSGSNHWYATPSNLSRATDQDLTNMTSGWIYKTSDFATIAGWLFDLTELKNIKYFCLRGIACRQQSYQGTCTITLQTSPDNVTYTTLKTITPSTNLQVQEVIGCMRNIRYIKVEISISADAGDSTDFDLYELAGFTL